MAMMGNFQKLQHTGTSPSDLFSVISRIFVGWMSYPSTEKQSVYSTAPVNGATCPGYDIRC